MPSRIDCHGHVWSADPATFPYGEDRGSPPEPTDKLGTAEVLLSGMKEADVQGFMIVQPIFHGFDHAYVSHALKKFGSVFKGMLLIDPTLSPEDAVAAIRGLHAEGYIGVRINSGLWNGKGAAIDDEVGRAVMGVVRPRALHPQALAADFPGTDIVIDHFAGVLPGKTTPPHTHPADLTLPDTSEPALVACEPLMRRACASLTPDTCPCR